MKKTSKMLLVIILLLGIFSINLAFPYITRVAAVAVDTSDTDAFGSYKRLEVMMERGSVAYTYDLGYTSNHYQNYVRTAFDVKIGGAARLSIEKNSVNRGTMYIQFFDSDYTKISSIAYTNQSIVDIPSGCDFIRIEIQTTDELESLAIRFYDGYSDPFEAKRMAMNKVSEKLTYKVSDDVHTTSRLMLPPNYTIDGEKVPLILWLEGSGSSLSSWSGDFNSNKLTYLQYLRDEGFAVFSVYAWGNEYAAKYPSCGNSFPYPIPINLECIKEGIEYICSRYNLDADNLHIMSKSQGGQVALYYASCNELNAKSIGMFAPVLDYLSMPGEAMYKDTRAAIAEELGFTGDVEYFASDRFLSYSDEGRAFLRENLDKLKILNEAWTNLSGAELEELFESSMDDCETFWTEEIWKTGRTDIYTHTEYVKTATVPVKIWGAKDDAATPYLKMVEVVAQLQNGGSIAELRTLTGGHSCADLGPTRVDVTTALGIEYTNVPVGWVENVEWIRNYTHTHNYFSTVTPPTCTEQGYTTYTCECGDSYIADEVVAIGHTEIVDEGKEPTELKPGLTEGKHCNVCGEVLVAQEEIPALGINVTFKINSARLNLDSDINIAYIATVPSDYTDFYMIFTFNGQDYRVDPVDNGDGRYRFLFDKVIPQMVGDNIVATLYATNAYDEIVTRCINEYSVRTYCINQLTKSNDAELKTMLSDLLVYAEKAQLYSGYKTDMLVTEGLEGIMTPSSFTSIDASVNKQQISGTVDSSVKWRSAGLVYQNAMALYIKFTATDIEGLEVRITRNGKTYIYTQDMFTLGTDGRYTILHQGIYFTQFDDDVTATFHRNGEQIGETLTYSVNSYIYRNQDAPDEKLCELLRATYVYGESAKAYKNK